MVQGGGSGQSSSFSIPFSFSILIWATLAASGDSIMDSLDTPLFPPFWAHRSVKDLIGVEQPFPLVS